MATPLVRHEIVHACPQCGAQHDSASPAGGGRRKPEAGDVTVCINCGGAAQFQDDLTLAKVDVSTLPEEMRHLVRKAQGFIVERRRPG